MIPRSVCFVAVVVATLFVWPARAAAEQACPEGASPDETRDLAATAFEDGQRLYNQGNYRGAIERFRCSFRLVPHPNTLFNIGESAELAGDPALALRTFRQYLEQYPGGQGHDQAEARVRVLEVTSARAPEPEAAPEPAVVPEPPEEPGERRLTAARRAAWATLALGVAIGATGGALYGVAVSRNGDYTENRDAYEQGLPTDWDSGDFTSAADRGHGLEGAGWALMGVGLASLVTSIVLFAAREGSEPVESSGGSASVGPIFGDGLVGLSVGGTF